LVDGKELVNLMIEHNVGVQTEKTYEIKKIDNDFFIED
jgi:restriction system protein